MKDVQLIREALATSLSSLPFQVTPWMLSDPTPPTAHVIPGPVTYDEAMHRGHDEMTFLIQAFVALSSDLGPQQLLDTLLDGEGSSSGEGARRGRHDTRRARRRSEGHGTHRLHAVQHVERCETDV